MAPASNGSGATNIYVADRGVDNNDNSAENDGKIYEFATGAGTGQPPIANFDWAQGTGFLVNFDDTSSNNATTWDWNFGDPSTTSDTASDPSPSYTYPAAGTYQVTLTVTNSFGTDSTTQAVTVSDSPPPTADNLLTNGSFEIDADGDTRPDGWTEHIAFLRHTTVPPIDGTYVGRHASSGGHSYTVYANAPVVAGRVYSMSGHYLAATTSDSFTLQIKIKWRGAGGNISTVTIKKYTDDTAGAWTSFSGIVTAPPTATSARVMMQVKSLNTNFHVDDFVLQEAP
jgi:PKD repeat protein